MEEDEKITEEMKKDPKIIYAYCKQLVYKKRCKKINYKIVGDKLNLMIEGFNSIVELMEKEEQRFLNEKQLYESESYFNLIALNLFE